MAMVGKMTAIFFLFLCLLCSGQLPGQAAEEPVTEDHKIRLHLGFGFAAFSAGKRLEDHFIKHNYDQSATRTIPFLGINNRTDFPVSESRPFTGEIGVAFRWRPRAWLGLMAGFDNFVNVKGYNGKAAFTRRHRSGFLSPQYSVDVPGYNFGFFVGPTLDFHRLETSGPNETVVDRKVRPGALGGVNIYMDRHFTFFAAFRWAARLRFEEQEGGSGIQMTVLPAANISFSYFRFGVGYQFVRRSS